MTSADLGPEDTLLEPLTERELDVLRLKVEGHTNQEIADQLYLALSTIKWYVRQVYGKLGVENREQAAERAGQMGLLDDEAVTVELRHNLPAQTTPFVGRDDELDELAALFADPDVRLVTILAPGGMGKTRLSLEAAEQQLASFPNGVFFVPLAPLRSPDNILSALAGQVGYQFQPDEREPKQQILDYLRAKQMLLVMDNFEHLLDGAGLVSEILAAAPAVKALATSRETLSLSGETLYPIGGMQFPDWETPEDALEYHAVRLFTQSARRARPDFGLEADDLTYLARICRLVQGMPLGIVLAAAWVNVLSLEEITGEIQRGLDILEAQWRDMPERHQSIRAVFDWTWQRLGDKERAVFMRMATFRGGFTRAAGQAIAGANLPLLSTMVNKALLTRNNEGRYDIHELLRQYAEEQLAASGDDAAARDTHMTYYAKALQEREADLESQRQIEASQAIGSDFENVRAAWLRAVEQGQPDVIAQMERPLWLYMNIHSVWHSGLELFERALALDGDTKLLARIMLRYAFFQYHILNYQQAETWLEKALETAQNVGDDVAVFLALSLLGRTVFNLHHDYERANQLADEGLAGWRDTGTRGLEGALALQTKIAIVGNHHFDLDTVQTLAQEMLDMARAGGDRLVMAAAYDNLGAVSSFLGDYAQGMEHLTQALDIWRELDEGGGGSRFTLSNVVATANALGDYEAAWDYANVLLAAAQEIGVDFLVGDALLRSADVLSLLGWHEEAQAKLQQASAILEGSASSTIISQRFSIEALLAYRRGDYTAALGPSRRALEQAQVADVGVFHVRRLLELGLVEIKNGEFEAAWKHLYEGLGAAVDGLHQAISSGLFGIAELERVAGRVERAVELAALVQQHPISWHEIKVYAGELLGELKDELPRETFDVAVKRGQALDYEAVVTEYLESYGK